MEKYKVLIRNNTFGATAHLCDACWATPPSLKRGSGKQLGSLNALAAHNAEKKRKAAERKRKAEEKKKRRKEIVENEKCTAEEVPVAPEVRGLPKNKKSTTPPLFFFFFFFIFNSRARDSLLFAVRCGGLCWRPLLGCFFFSP